ncbi:MAG: hypothetical protein B7Z02_18365 [Rhodobacterales bacterium 32-67-9]|nr:MAG: hypothetical protein B7Z02_18365 [Rhodobacterales bacterium 32-67-9]
MARAREVATLWTGGSLSWLEQLCLKSFVDRGQKVTLFSYADVANLPEGVIRRDAGEIAAADALAGGGVAVERELFRDYFRIQVLRHWSGTIWVDPDVYCHRPLDFDGDYVLGFAVPESDEVGLSVLGLPVQSPILADLTALMSDPHAIPPHLKPSRIAACEAAKAAGRPVHVGRQPAGAWGAKMITHLVGAHRLKGKVQPADTFYPVSLSRRRALLRAPGKVAAMLTDRTVAMPLWRANRQEIALWYGGLPPRGSCLEELAKLHGIRPEDAPVDHRGNGAGEPGLLGFLPEGKRVASLADLGGTAEALALAAHARDGCRIVLIDVDDRGEFAKTESSWVAPYRKALARAGVPAGQVSVIRDAAGLGPVDLLCNLAGFGDAHEVGGLEPFLTACLHPDSLMLMDLRKGSGGYPFLKALGRCETISSRKDARGTVSRVLFRPVSADR